MTGEIQMKKRSKKREKDIEDLIKLALVGAFFLFYTLTDSLGTTFVIMFFISAIAVGFFINQSFKRKRDLRSSGIKEIDEMDGIRFEYFLRELYISLGYKVKVTKSTGDFGADLVLIKEGQKVVVQAKRYSKNVGVKAVQEVKTSQMHYKASESWVVTNSYFTRQAMELAKSNSVKLIDRDQLIKTIVTMQTVQRKAV